MITIYCISILLSLILCFWYYSVDVRRSITQNIMILTVLVANMGYLARAMSTNLETAILATKILHVGACFLPMLFFFTVCEVCRIHLPKIVILLLVLLQTLLFGLVCTIGYNEIYYKTVEYVINDGIVSLNRTYGIGYWLYPASLLVYLAASFLFSQYSLIIKKNVESSTIIIMMSCLGIVSAYYCIQHIVKLIYDFTPLNYIFFLGGAIIPIYRSDIYDVTENDEVIAHQLNNVGFLTFTNEMRFMGANQYAINMFKVLDRSPLGERLFNPPEELRNSLKEIGIFLEGSRKSRGSFSVEGSNIKIGNKTFKTEIHSLTNPTRRCLGAILEFRDISDHMKMIELTEKYNERLEKEVSLKTKRIRNIQEKTIFGMALMVESRDQSTGGHIKRTSEVVKIFSQKLLDEDMGFDNNFLNLVIRSAPMHDLGKIGVDDAILRKNGKFTDEEYEKMKEHSKIGGQMVLNILDGVEEPEFVSVAYNAANYHHEKFNGKGYPEGLAGEAIPIEARIMALADVFDALVSKRCYKEAFSYDKAFSIIKQDAGTHFDPRLAPLFLECRPELEAYYDMEFQSEEK